MNTIKQGSSGTAVLSLQKALTAAGFSCAIDGSFGPLTEEQVKAFQTSKGLTADGIVGMDTWKALGLKPSAYIMGVDVSHYETGFNFARAVVDGLIFMMTKFSEGTGLDSSGSSECAKAKAAGVKYKGGYHFHHAGISVAKQISAFFRQYSAIQTEMPPILDLEETSMDGLSAAAVKDSAIDWLQQAETKSGKTPILYIDMNMISILGILKDPRFKRYPLWVARYSSNEPPVAWTFWQYTDKGEQGADTDRFHGSEADLKAFLGIA